ncbi:Adenosine monophosphate-protein transferase and cysteine protease ibpA [Heracleum sosnowskyi]|uniref:Adenosine monophosphate-protein transferase and cysteine protease ibpA n=1 Tax=Heracleum sosnowskyi TaxID=360622 RepID=A0AAD8MUZ5_9APIA|nr:Adenosine monophosphate-protein transferase and cysteine protease ibpA [Heracleum sosnowskyi]
MDLINQTISKEDVISKIKDDGDFDRLRVKIVRKLKENEELRSSIVSAVRQSAALNSPGFENLKPRQLSDAIHQEIGEKVMSQISDGVWEVIRSGDGMKSEIDETVQSVYSRLLNPQESQGGEPSSNADAMAVEVRPDKNGSVVALPDESNGTFSDSEPNEPPGFALHLHQNSNLEEQLKEEPQDKLLSEEHKREARCSDDVFDGYNVKSTTRPTVSTTEDQNQPGDGSDEDPDLPPGFA